MKSQKTASKQQPLLYQTQTSNLAAAAEVNMDKFRVGGYTRVVGSFHASSAAAAGFPRVRQSADGVNWSLSYVIAQDLSMAGFQYPFSIPLYLPYVSIEYTQGAADSTFFHCYAEARVD